MIGLDTNILLRLILQDDETHSQKALALVGGLVWWRGRRRDSRNLQVGLSLCFVMIALYLMAPPTPVTFYVFAAALGFTWLATVPPTAGLVGKLFGPRYLGTLFGLTLLSHQIGGFFGAWLGGLALEHTGNYLWMWYADALLAAIAALVNLPIREARMPTAAAPA